MHELGLAQEALDVALATAQRQGARRIVAMHLRIGGLSGVVPEALRFALETITAGTPAEGARILMERVIPFCRCEACGGEYEVVDCSYACPMCGDTRGRLSRGKELDLVSLEVA